MFGGLGILAGNERSWACIPLSIRLHDGLQAAREWKDAAVSSSSHVIQMVENAYFMEKQPELQITQIIRNQQDTSGTYEDSLAS